MYLKSISTSTIALIFSIFILLALLAFFTVSSDHDAEPDPAPVASVAWSMKEANAISMLETSVMKAPKDIGSRVALAQAYLREGQLSLNEAYYIPRAQEQLDVVMSHDPEHYEALALQASLYNTLHQFEKARELTESLIERAGGHAYVYGILIDALVELGEYELAVQRCDEMIALRPGLASYSRASYLRELHGDGEGALEAMTLAAEAGVTGEVDRSWALYQLGLLYLAEEDLETAAVIFEGILDETPYYAYALGGIGHIALQSGEAKEAIERFKEAYAFVPADEFLQAQIEAYLMLDDQDAVNNLIQALEQSYLDADAMGENVRMEYADFLADNDMQLEKALRLAKLEYLRRPHHLHALETYAWSLHKNGRSEEAIPYIEQAMRLDTGDAMVHYRAGHIYRSAGYPDAVQLQFELALNANLHIESPSAAAEISILVKS